MSYPESFISVFARNCCVRRIDARTADDFLSVNHRFGYSKCKYCYGLFVERSSGRDTGPDKGTLVAVSCFSNARRWKKGDDMISSYEWVRYASLIGIRVAGGMGKALKAFIEDIHPDDIMSYAPLSDGTEGGVYTTLGFQLEGIKEINGAKSAKFRMKLKNYV